jgi:hypothetical protein
VSGSTNEQIVGSVAAIDPEGDPITYAVTDGPQHGTVTLGPDGSYTYTPDTDFTGVDTFSVAVADTGWHVNLLKPFLPPPADAVVTVVVGTTIVGVTPGTAYEGYAPPADCACKQTWSYMEQFFTNGQCGNPDNDVSGPWCQLESSPDGRTWSYCKPRSA